MGWGYFPQGKYSSYNKFSNEKLEFMGEKFDSKAELRYYLVLMDMVKKGEITDLQRQVVFELQPSFKNSKGKTVRAIKYIADFVYKDKEGKRHIVDVKGSKATMTKEYLIKAKIMAYQGNEIEEVFL